ncbi:MAG: hypothetical protein UW94_C0002G0009 [Parcubacteria group bacterium GW2011_GWA2_45_14]|nr:MAG: hypothetical protein UW94_C0002G0009 [Parcubacteria group bacterium GW2011_GWA2_45_14]OGY33563.1 MAG: hypothetical protein A3B76_05945 [Candidatus Andersenbacteria bacterium RIFCSPHIGHO2_02_FULL_46_16]
MNVIKGQKAIQTYYDKYYLDEHKDYFTASRAAQEVNFLIESLSKKPHSVCDVGCGDGRHLKVFQQLGIPNGLGIDLSNQLVKQAKKNVNDSNFTIQNQSFADWQPEHECYDITYCIFSSFSYCRDLSEAQNLITKMVSATTMEGIICVDIDNVFRLVRFLTEHNKKAEDTDELEFDAINLHLLAREKRGRAVLESSTQYFMAPEIKTLFATAGIKNSNLVFKGGFNKDKYSYRSDRLIVIAKKQDK